MNRALAYDRHSCPILLKELISPMTIRGIATEISGSEHLISHVLDPMGRKAANARHSSRCRCLHYGACAGASA